jgi:hypothetical protein
VRVQRDDTDFVMAYNEIVVARDRIVSVAMSMSSKLHAG